MSLEEKIDTSSAAKQLNIDRSTIYRELKYAK